MQVNDSLEVIFFQVHNILEMKASANTDICACNSVFLKMQQKHRIRVVLCSLR